MDILKVITNNKRREVSACRAVFDTKLMRQAAETTKYQPVSLKDAIINSPTGIIAECKRRSPSKGDIHPAANVESVISGYYAGGAAACSILTDTAFFGGSLTDLAVARKSSSLPLLRKDFIIDEYQIYQSRAMGADAILLIAASLSKEEITRYITIAHDLGLETLLELHNENEIELIDENTDMIGVNNRNLSSFTTDLSTSDKLVKSLPADIIKIAESGLSNRSDMDYLKSHGYNGFLIGERFMRHPDPGQALIQFLNGNEN